MSSTKTETKIETKTETQKGKGRVAPGGDEPPRPGTPPDDPAGSDGDLADINEFNKAFNELARDSEHNNAGLKLFYKQGINPALKATIDKFEVIPTTFEGWQKAAVRKYNDWVRSKAEEKAWGRRKLTTTNSTTTTTTIRATNTSRNTASMPGGRLTPEEYATYMKEGQCFDCGQKGHMCNSPDCSKKKALTLAASTSGNWRQTTTQNVRATTASAPTAGSTSDSPASTTPATTDDAISIAARALAALTPEQHAALASVFSKKDF
ncbi:hypothetical protein PQX77_012002 [Marasmius sp. AFHP31]|nr:hypothetical protein PQX77_012002 [Marasmius sp. AFHP31]